MNKNSNNRRSRGRGGNKRHGNVRNQTFESNGPGVKVRGSAQQVLDKYLALARDASSSGDRIMAESYFQFAEHYFRLLNTDEQRNADRNGANRGRGNDRDRANTPGSAEGGPDDQMSGGGYDNDGDSDGEDSSGDNGAEVIRTDRPQAQNDGGDGDNGDNADSNKGDRGNSRDASSGGESKGRGRNRNARNSGGGDNDAADQAPPARSRGRRKKPAAEAEGGEDAQPDLLSESKADAPVENDAAD
jgi:hypothetical protein